MSEIDQGSTLGKVSELIRWEQLKAVKRPPEKVHRTEEKKADVKNKGRK